MGCRTEAEYAYQLRKPVVPIKFEDYNADGWLGAITGTKLWFSFAGLNRGDYQSKFNELQKAIERHIPNASSMSAEASMMADSKTEEQLAEAQARASTAEMEIKKLQAEIRHLKQGKTLDDSALTQADASVASQLKSMVEEMQRMSKKLEHIEAKLSTSS